ncbi:hypothetical protein [Virgibacillus necropolis]|uniref:Uncharacterized protein n=1 Tax=Virgibacillus necropolis TaxID=163877 RepID=A0A221MD95_9BACI|nr:hypothetical protein [Virgibacillus necropolis]ASN05633.1 hypothetical protein CFK40_11735 [Virgibacillus necropolis]
MRAIKKFFTIIIVIGLIITGLFIFVPFKSEPPTPTVTAGGTTIPTTEGSYCWDGLFSAQCVDKVYTGPLDMAKEHNPTVVSPNEEIKIDFKKEPKTIEVEQWIDNENTGNIEVKTNSLLAPKEKGKYVYNVLADWKQGDVNYVFSIEVK